MTRLYPRFERLDQEDRDARISFVVARVRAPKGRELRAAAPHRRRRGRCRGRRRLSHSWIVLALRPSNRPVVQRLDLRLDSPACECVPPAAPWCTAWADTSDLNIAVSA